MLEKQLEAKFRQAVILKLHGLCIKLAVVYFAGMPDRMCLLPGGRIFFAELKAPGRHPSPVQVCIHNKLRALGFDVEVIDSVDRINEVIQHYETK